jgi:TonB family protein
VYNQAQVSKKARLLSKPQPVYTKTAAEKLITGVVRLRAVLSSSGKVTEIRPLNSLPEGLTDQAIAAAQQITFEPAIKDGKPVSQWVTLEYNFRLFPDADDPSLKSSARILEKPQPEYPGLTRERKIDGKVILELALMPDGSVQVYKVIERLPDGLTEAAIEAAKKIKFVPAVYKDGRVTGQYYRIEYTFGPTR